MSVGILLSRLEGVKKTGAGRYRARCPVHGGRSGTLAIKEEADGTLLLHCHALCPISEVLTEIGLGFPDLFPEKITDHTEKGHTPRPRVKRPWRTSDVTGALLFELQVVWVVLADVVSGKALSSVDRSRAAVAVQRIERRAAQRDDYITKRAHVEYKEGATCPTWEKFLGRIFGGNADLIEFMRRALGYSLTGDTGEQCLFLPHGGGANGKSTALDVMRSILGDYAIASPTDLLMTKRAGAATNDVARLRGARLVAAVETEDGRRMAEGLVKQLTGGDAVAARFLFAEYFEFKPAFKIWLAANHKPVIRGDDYAIWRRIRLIPFAVTIPPDERDKNLPARLIAESAGILQWLIRGCLEWQRIGLVPPKEVLAATAAYKADSDTIGQWIAECCIREG